MTVIADAITIRDTAPTAASSTKAIAAAGPIQDLKGTGYLIYEHVAELKVLLTNYRASLDSGDPNYTTAGTMLTAIG